MAIVRWSPFFRDVVSFRDAVDRLFEESFVNADRLFSWTGIAARTMPLEMVETPDEIVVRALVPGVAPDKLEVSYHQGLLTLRAQTEAQPSHDNWVWHVREFGYGEMIRSISLPKAVDPDRAVATFENGILTLRLPKAEHEKPKQIKISLVTDGATH
jgi:HSP20 family protein